MLLYEGPVRTTFALTARFIASTVDKTQPQPRHATHHFRVPQGAVSASPYLWFGQCRSWSSLLTEWSISFVPERLSFPLAIRCEEISQGIATSGKKHNASNPEKLHSANLTSNFY